MSENNMIVYTQKLEEILKKDFKDEVTPEFLNLIRAAITTHEHAFQKYGITKDKYIEWISQAWDAGVHQRRVYDMEVEGGVNNYIGVSFDFGAYLSLWGQKKGYITKFKKG